MKFVYMISGFEGSSSDSAMYDTARFRTLAIPEGFVYVADAGFPTCKQLLVPYRGQRYHLREWRASNQRYFPLSFC